MIERQVTTKKQFCFGSLRSSSCCFYGPRMLSLFKGNNNTPKQQPESKPLIDPRSAAIGAVAGATFLNESAEAVRRATGDGPLTFRMMGFFGGLAMVVSNGIAILDRFFSFQFAGSIIALYGLLFGIIITILEAPGPYPKSLQKRIRTHANFLSFTWGRGALFFFVGSLQINNINILDWAVGGFMMFVGIVALCAGVATARDLRLLKMRIKDESTLKQKWKDHDVNKDGKLDIKELSAFIRDERIKISRNEVAAAFMALDKDFDDQVSYEEFLQWWRSASVIEAEGVFCV